MLHISQLQEPLRGVEEDVRNVAIEDQAYLNSLPSTENFEIMRGF